MFENKLKWENLRKRRILDIQPMTTHDRKKDTDNESQVLGLKEKIRPVLKDF